MTGLSLRGIVSALGGNAYPGWALVPGPGHRPKDRSLSIRLSSSDPDGFVVNSFAHDDWKACRDHVRERLGLPAADKCYGPLSLRRRDASAARETRADALAARREATIRKTAATIAARLVPIIGTPAEAYLRQARGIDVDAIRDVLERTDAIGWHSSVYFREEGHPLDGKRLGALIGIMTDPATALPTGAISRTYLGPDGKKLGKAKSLGSPAGIIRLSEDADVLAGLHLAEGIETALAAMSIGLRPMWATGSTALMAKFPVLNGIEALTIIADNDANGAGERAAREVAERWRGADREVRTIVWSKTGDINDAIREGGDEP